MDLQTIRMALEQPLTAREVASICGLEPELIPGIVSTMGDGMALEHERSVIHNAAVTPEMVEARRAAVQARGRTQ